MSKLKMWNRQDVPYYCSLCGRRLREQLYKAGFSETTGKQLINTLLYCPAWLGTHILSHYVIRFNSEGDEIIERY